MILIGHADDRIDAVEIVRAIEIGDSRPVWSASVILRIVEASADMQAQSVGDVEIVEHIDAEIGVLRPDIARRNIVSRFVDIFAAPGNDEIGGKVAKVLLPMKCVQPLSMLTPRGDGVVMAEDLVGIGQLRGRAGAQRARPVAVDLTQGLAVRQRPFRERVARPAIGVGDHHSCCRHLRWRQADRNR